MIQQPNPEKVYDGEKLDRIGPGHYEIKREIMNINRGKDFHSSKSRRVKNKASNLIGPGYYEISKSVGKNSTKSINNSKRYKIIQKPIHESEKENQTNFNFLGESDKANITNKDENELPGPGEYFNEKLHSSFIMPKHKYNKVQCFGSNVERFQSDNEKAELGPGYYKEEKNIAKSYNIKMIPFNSGHKRFPPSFTDKKANPGPGTYYGLPKIRFKRPRENTINGVFGSIETRFTTKRSIRTPGPAEYNTQYNNRGNRLNDGKPPNSNSSMFECNCHRFNVKIPDEIKNGKFTGQDAKTIKENLNYKLRKSESLIKVDSMSSSTGFSSSNGFNSKQARFKNSFFRLSNFNPPGPGYYEVSNKEPISHVNAVFRAKRFNNELSIIPGPGYYRNVGNNWTKKTFNMLFT